MAVLAISTFACPLAAQPQPEKAASDGLQRPSEIRTGVYRGNSVTYAMIAGRPIFEGDIILDHITEGTRDAAKPSPNGIGIAYAQYFWPKNGSGVAQVPYTITNGQPNLTAAINQFNATFTGIIQFVARTTETDYADFNFNSADQSGVCDSYIGRTGGKQEVTGSGSCSLGTLLHEMGHVIGLYHEQSRPDRNTYVTVNYNNVIKGSRSNFDQPMDDYQDLGFYDYASVMHYIPYAFSRNGGATIESIPAGMPLSNLTGYSVADIDTIKRLYGAAPTQVTIASNPEGLTVTVDGANVTTPHSYTWARNSTHTLDVPADAQTLSAHTYIYGRWNDNTAASHTITIKPGNGTLVAPVKSPAVTVYAANFIQLAQYTGQVYPAGSGSVGVSPTPQSYSGATGVYLIARQAVTLTPTPGAGYNFLEWGGTSAPWSANPKPDLVPDGAASYAVTAYFTKQPITTIATSPAGLGFTVDGNYWYGPQNFSSDYFSGWTPGSSHTVAVWTPEQPYSYNSRFSFANWSDGGAASHSIILPSGASTLTATFTPQFLPIAYATPSCGGNVTISPTSADGFYNQGTTVTVAETPASGWILTSWLYDLVGRVASRKLVVNDEELAVANYDTTTAALAVTALSPWLLKAGGAGQTVAIKGRGFTSSSVVFVNNVYRATSFISAGQINVALTASDIAAAGAFPIGVSNFPSGAPCSAYAAKGLFVRS
jgi:astacin